MLQARDASFARRLPPHYCRHARHARKLRFAIRDVDPTDEIPSQLRRGPGRGRRPGARRGPREGQYQAVLGAVGFGVLSQDLVTPVGETFRLTFDLANDAAGFNFFEIE